MFVSDHPEQLCKSDTTQNKDARYHPETIMVTMDIIQNNGVCLILHRNNYAQYHPEQLSDITYNSYVCLISPIIIIPV